VDQSRFYGDLTEQVLLSAGITSGMRVLDVGCGAGDVSLLVATLVGPSGSVIGVDKHRDAIAAAAERARTAKVENAADDGEARRATAEQVEIDTLAQRIRDEVVAGGGVVVPPPLIGA
jgi:ubiquinone/menaquinone biosynthesis C-methylase UbiE